MASPSIVDVEDPDFEREVVERSRSAAVIADFWAPWCGPCRTLGPLLEKLVAEHPGELTLARIDVDRAPGLAQRFGVRSIPTVLGFRDGAVVADFEGAQPEPVLRRFVEALLPSEADRLARRGDERAATDPDDAAEQDYRAALEADPRQPAALLGLARLLADRDDPQAALDLLERIRPGVPQETQADRLAATLRTRAAGPDDDEASLRARLAADPDDLEVRLALGRALARAERHEEALEELLAVVRRDPSHADQAARKAMLDLFEVLGSDDPLTTRFRAELARALFR